MEASRVNPATSSHNIKIVQLKLNNSISNEDDYEQHIQDERAMQVTPAHYNLQSSQIFNSEQTEEQMPNAPDPMTQPSQPDGEIHGSEDYKFNMTGTTFNVNYEQTAQKVAPQVEQEELIEIDDQRQVEVSAEQESDCHVDQPEDSSNHQEEEAEEEFDQESQSKMSFDPEIEAKFIAEILKQRCDVVEEEEYQKSSSSIIQGNSS